MFQIFLLTVFLNIFGGALLAADFLKEKLPGVGSLQSFMAENKAYTTLVSVGLVAVGVLKFIYSLLRLAVHSYRIWSLPFWL